MRTSIRLYLSTLFPNIRYIDKYVRGAMWLKNRHRDRVRLLDEFMTYCNAESRRCLQFGVRDAKYGKNWVSVDLYA